MSSKYLIDANVFIEAQNHHYGMDFCPAFWDWLISANRREKVVSIQAVFEELTPAASGSEEEDEVSKWVRAAGKPLFLSHDEEMIAQLPKVSVWAMGQGVRYRPEAVSQFLSCADYHLVAYALAHGCTLVTHEVTDNSPKRIKLPDVCANFNITCIRPFKMLRDEEARFIMRLSSRELFTEPDAI